MRLPTAFAPFSAVIIRLRGRGRQNVWCAFSHRLPIQISYSQRFAARIVCGPGQAVISAPFAGAFFFSPRHKPRGWSTERRTSLPLSRTPLPKCGRLSALHRGSHLRRIASDTGPGSALPGTRHWASPSPASCSRRGHNAPRAESRTSRERGYEPRPQAPHPTPPSFASHENAPRVGGIR